MTNGICTKRVNQLADSHYNLFFKKGTCLLRTVYQTSTMLQLKIELTTVRNTNGKRRSN
jgi:hypothetical protein